MSDALPALVEQLCAISLVDEAEDLDRLLLALEQRQRLLTAIQNADASDLAPELRDQLNGQLEELRARDDELLAYLCAEREITQKSLEKLSQGRAAVRGYGGARDSARPPPRRIG